MSKVQAYALVHLGVIAACIFLVIAEVVIFFSSGAIYEVFSGSVPAGSLWLVPILAFPMSIYGLLTQLALRGLRFRSIGGRNVLQGVSTAFFQGGLGLLGQRSLGLSFGAVIGQVVGVLLLLRGSGLLSLQARLGRRLLLMRAVARRYRRFPLYLTLSGLLNSLGLQLPILIIANSYSGEIAGWLGMAQRVLSVPVTLIGMALSQVFLGSFAQIRRSGAGNLKVLFRRTATRLTAMSLIVVAPVAFAGPWLFSWFLGARWGQSGTYAQALSVGVLFQLVASPLSPTLALLEKQGLQLTWDGARLLLVAVATLLAVGSGLPVVQVVWVLAGSQVVAYAVSVYLSWRAVAAADRGDRAT